MYPIIIGYQKDTGGPYACYYLPPETLQDRSIDIEVRKYPDKNVWKLSGWASRVHTNKVISHYENFKSFGAALGALIKFKKRAIKHVGTKRHLMPEKIIRIKNQKTVKRGTLW